MATCKKASICLLVLAVLGSGCATTREPLSLRAPINSACVLVEYRDVIVATGNVGVLDAGQLGDLSFPGDARWSWITTVIPKGKFAELVEVLSTLPAGWWESTAVLVVDDPVTGKVTPGFIHGCQREVIRRGVKLKDHRILIHTHMVILLETPSSKSWSEEALDVFRSKGFVVVRSHDLFPVPEDTAREELGE